MNGAEALVRTLVECGVVECFANPGTSEMHLVQAIDAVPEMHAALCLFEGVCTGAADGYGRITGKPAVTLLHLGAGLANGLANLHNARRARSPVINVVGDHARDHVHRDAPLTSDIEGVARPMSAWVRTAATAEGLGHDAADAVSAALTHRPGAEGSVATLIVPVDCAWGQGRFAHPNPPPARPPVTSAAVDAARAVLGPQAVLLLDGSALSEEGLVHANRIAATTGARMLAATFAARVDLGPGLPRVSRLPYFPEPAMAELEGARHLVLAGAEPPVSFFAYPATPGDLTPQGCSVVRLAHAHEDVVDALEALAAAVDASATAGQLNGRQRPEVPAGRLNTANAALILAAHLPDGSIVAADSGGGGALFDPVQSAARCTWLNITGGAIGQGGPVSVGAARARPEARVFALLGDGAAMYTNQFLWTHAREQQNVTTVVFSNQKYGILETEYRRLGVNEIGERAARLFDLGEPGIDWVKLAEAQGVPASRASTCEEFDQALRRAVAEPGPRLIEAMV